MGLFVDSSAWYAAANQKDRHNLRAKQVLQSDQDLITTDHILVECWLLLWRSVGRQAANRFWGAILEGAAFLERVTPEDLERAWRVGQAFSDQDFSLVDLTSFVVMERLGIHRVATFDKDFVIYRYGEDRQRAFEVVR